METSGSATNTFYQEPSEVWIVAVRSVLLAAALLGISVWIFLSRPAVATQLATLYLPLAVLFGITGLSAWWIRHREVGEKFYYSQFFLDTLIVTGIVYISGGPASPFLFLYLPLVMSASIFVSRRAALFTSLFASVSYAILGWCMIHGVIVPPDGATVVPAPASGMFLQWLGLASAMILVAVGTSYLRKSLRSSIKFAEQSQRYLADLYRQREALFESLPDGVLTTDLAFRISAINSSACRILGVLADEVAGMTLEELVQRLRVDSEVDGVFEVSDHSREIAVIDEQSEKERKIRYHSKAVTGEADRVVGRMFILQDVTHLRTIEEQLAVQDRMARLLAEQGPGLADEEISFEGFVGDSPVMRKLFRLIHRVAPSEATVLVSGESGTGKELVAKAIHKTGSRISGPFIPVNCGAIPETLIESELFGHKKGSFTGAVSDHTGLFRQAEGGTIFLDEIGELPLQTQAKLLRAIQEKSVRPVGGEKAVPIDVRIIAATNRNLKDDAKEGTFREDLYYRLNVISLNLPPLRDRREDIPLLVNAILNRISGENNPPLVAPQTMQQLLSYPYPGNVRELENILERAIVFGGDAILPEHLPEVVADHSADYELCMRSETEILVDESLTFPINLDQILKETEQRYLQLALSKTGGAKKKAAELCGINFRSFRYRLQKFGID